MMFFLESVNAITYFLCVESIGELFLGFELKKIRYKEVILVVVAIITAAVMLNFNIWIKVIGHALSSIIVSNVFFKESWKKILGLYVASMAVLSMLSMLFSVISTEIILFYQIKDIYNIAKVACSIVVLFIIQIVGKYYKNKCGAGLKSMDVKYWVFFMVVMFFDSTVMVVIGDFIINTVHVQRQDIVIFSYWCVVIGLLIQLVLLINTLVTRNVHKENEMLAKQFLESQNEHYQYLEKREYETKKFRHDIKNHLLLVENLIATEKYDEAECYLNTINEKVLSFSNQISVNNGIAEAILNRFYAEAKEDGVALKVKGHFPMGCYISAYDICTILSNLLSNAIRAAKEAGGNEVLMNIKYTENQVMLAIENDFEELDEVDGVFKSTKRDSLGHGFGLSNVNECVEKNGGFMSISTQNRRFKVMIMLLNEDEGTNENCNRG